MTPRGDRGAVAGLSRRRRGTVAAPSRGGRDAVAGRSRRRRGMVAAPMRDGRVVAVAGGSRRRRLGGRVAVAGQSRRLRGALAPPPQDNRDGSIRSRPAQALAAEAGLFDVDGDDGGGGGGLTTVGVAGAATALRPCRAAGLVLGTSQIAAPTVLVGSLPQWDQLGQTGPALLLGLDVLESFRATRSTEAPRKKSRAAKKSRGDGASLSAPTDGDVWSLELRGRR